MRIAIWMFVMTQIPFETLDKGSDLVGTVVGIFIGLSLVACFWQDLTEIFGRE